MDLSSWILSTFHLLVCLSICKQFFLFMSAGLSMVAILSQKSWFLTTKKNQFFSSAEKILHHTRKFIKQKCSNSLSYRWNGPTFLTSDQSLKCYSQTSDFWKNAKNFKICQNLNFTFFTAIIAQGRKITNEGYFFLHMGTNIYVHGFMT